MRVKYNAGSVAFMCVVPECHQGPRPLDADFHACSGVKPKAMKKGGYMPPFFCYFNVKRLDLLFLQSLHGQADPALLVHFQHLDLDDLAFAQFVGDVLHTLTRDL